MDTTARRGLGRSGRIRGPLEQQKARHGSGRAGRWPVQLRYACALTGAQYVNQQAWEQARLPRCPLHPQGGCGFARHGTYRRVTPPGTRVARWYCRRGHRTFSLLPDCLAARLSGTLSEVEAVVRAVEQAPSLEAACQELRPDIELPGVLRWARRRVQAVHAALQALKGLLPEQFPCVPPPWPPSPPGWASPRPWSRDPPSVSRFLQSLSSPLGFRPRRTPVGGRGRARQQRRGGRTRRGWRRRVPPRRHVACVARRGTLTLNDPDPDRRPGHRPVPLRGDCPRLFAPAPRLQGPLQTPRRAGRARLHHPRQHPYPHRRQDAARLAEGLSPWRLRGLGSQAPRRPRRGPRLARGGGGRGAARGQGGQPQTLGPVGHPHGQTVARTCRRSCRCQPPPCIACSPVMG